VPCIHYAICGWHENTKYIYFLSYIAQRIQLKFTSSMDDVDWDDGVLPDVLLEEDRGDDHDQQLVVPLPMPAHAEQQLAVPVRPKSKWSVAIPGNVHTRTEHEKCLAASRMRDAKAAKAARQLKKFNVELIDSSFAKLREAGLLRDGGKLSAKQIVTGIPFEIDGASRPSVLPFLAMQHIAYSKISSRNNVSLAFSVNPKTVVKVRNLVAASHLHGDEMFLRALGQQFKLKPPVAFTSSMSSDCASEVLNLPMLGMEGAPSAITRSSWHVLVSTNRFAWTGASEDVHKWNRADFIRPNVALTGSETGEVLHDGMYLVGAIKPFADLELIGMTTARFPMMHFDVDGHGANLRCVGIRRDEIIDAGLPSSNPPCVSLWHCGNHRNGISESATQSAVGQDALTFLTTGAVFFKMGGNFLRLVQAVAVVFDKLLPKPVVGEPPPLAKELSDELRDFAVCNYKFFVFSRSNHVAAGDDDDGIDQKLEADRRRRSWLYNRAWDDFLSFFNGFIWTADDTLPKAFVAIRVADFGKWKVDAVRATVSLLLRAMPVKPCKGKWTKTSMSSDWNTLATGTLNLLRNVWPTAFAKLRLKVFAPLESSMDPSVVQEFNWHALESTRCNYLGRHMDEHTHQLITILSISLEGLKCLTKWWMSCASTVRRIRKQSHNCLPPLCDLVSLAHSPAVAVCQHYSHLMSK
jgi:hypothetical protein